MLQYFHNHFGAMYNIHHLPQHYMHSTEENLQKKIIPYQQGTVADLSSELVEITRFHSVTETSFHWKTFFVQIIRNYRFEKVDVT